MFNFMTTIGCKIKTLSTSWCWDGLSSIYITLCWDAAWYNFTVSTILSAPRFRNKLNPSRPEGVFTSYSEVGFLAFGIFDSERKLTTVLTIYLNKLFHYNKTYIFWIKLGLLGSKGGVLCFFPACHFLLWNVSSNEFDPISTLQPLKRNENQGWKHTHFFL